uniref:endoribonuclease Dicer homolog 2-like n=1 Tax=Erigeron canadensis TaxID=72917 RepID=UPI001CB8C066|nr:endoribonuclease Dicer homolog 2-like [Erigeron canadensis]
MDDETIFNLQPQKTLKDLIKDPQGSRTPPFLATFYLYQIEALEQAIKQNTIVFLDTGSGKTLIAIMLLRCYAHLLTKPSSNFAVFLVPTVVLVKQQAEAVRKYLDLKVEEYWGEKKGMDYWNASDWTKQRDENQVMVMTPAILHDALTHKFLRLDNIKLLIFDECHNAKKRHPYALIMNEFYHRQLRDGITELPRILGMTASPVKGKGLSSTEDYWKEIKNLENQLNSKVFTCEVAESVPISAPQYKYYQSIEFPDQVLKELKCTLLLLREKHEITIKKANISESSMDHSMKRLSKLSSIFEFCLQELGIWLAVKATEAYACEENDLFTGALDVRGDTIAREFCKDANKAFSSYIPAEWMISHINQESVRIGLISAKVVCLLESLAEYRHVNDMRCIIFVERVITAIVLKSLLRELNPKLFGWRTEYTAGNHSTMQSQSRGVQNKIVEEFRKGMVNIIVATSILEEGLDVQKCNLVIRFDLSATICSFIQSRGRARMSNSEFVLLIKSGDTETLEKANNYLLSGKLMRDQSLNHASEPCEPLDSEMLDEDVYCVESTGATLSLSSSIGMVNFYCSRLPSDGYFKPYPSFITDKESGTCTILFPKSCPLPRVCIESKGKSKMLKRIACLEACKQLHKMGALTDNLVPDTVEEADDSQEIEYDYEEEKVQYVPPELVGRLGVDSDKVYHFYSIKLKKNFDYNVEFQDIVLGVKTELELDSQGLSFELEVDRGTLSASVAYLGMSMFTSEQISLLNKFQLTMFKVLLDHSITELMKSLEVIKSKKDIMGFEYLLLPSMGLNKASSIFDWNSVRSIQFPHEEKHNCSLTSNNHHQVHTRNGLICSCLVESSLVYTPHNGRLYCTTEWLHGMNSNSLLETKEDETITYKDYYKTKYDIDLKYDSFFLARQLFVVQNFLQRGRHHKEKEIRNVRVQLPSEVCYIIMSPISLSTFYSFSFLPSVMHRIESWLLAINLKKLHVDHTLSNANVSPLKVLEAITTKKCLESYNLESFEILGDSFLKYAATQHLFKSLQNQHEGILSSRREKIISNESLCRLGCRCNILGFIRNEPFDPKAWVIPGDRSANLNLEEKVFPTGRRGYIGRKRTLKKKVVADVVESLIGVFLSEGGESAALSFMGWLGIEVDFGNTLYARTMIPQPEKFVSIDQLESVLSYSFQDPSLLVEALTHGSYMLPEIPRCYQRLEFLGDAVLDYLMTVHLYRKYPGISPGLLTDLRSASVNNDCYAQSSVRVGLHKHILHGSQVLHRNIVSAVDDFEQLQLVSTFGWESESTFPKVLGDVIESIAGAILVDSGYDKDQVFRSIRPLLEPLVTPETLRLHPVKELHDLLQKKHFGIKKSAKRTLEGTISFTIEVEAEGIVFKDSCVAQDKKMAERLASKSVLKLIKEIFPGI